MIGSSYQKLIISQSEKQITLLGYPLELTDAEYAIVTLLHAEGGASRQRLGDICPMQSIPVHVCNINRKSRRITQRPLIVFGEGVYRINENL